MGETAGRRLPLLKRSNRPESRTALSRALAFSALGAVALLLPLPPRPEWQTLLNLAHVPLLAVLAWLWLAALRSLGLAWPRALIIVTLGGALAGAGVELLQWFIPGRWPDPQDLLLNLLGLAVGSLLFWLAQRHRRG